ncbi:MAG: hypothetical protein KC457_20800 [Myxococcales bacterium]|nr:hypothetical protein [Myxococcales bacterium]
MPSRLPRLALALLLAPVSCGGDDEPTPSEDPGSLCACREVDGETECCFGHGECVEQEEGPRVCACDPGARGDTCSTPSPGVHAVRQRPGCSEGDPGCEHEYDYVVVESFDSCPDLDGDPFDSIIVRPATGPGGGWPDAILPLATLTHGASQDPADYYDLLEHVAANGVVMAAFDATAGTDILSRANRTLAYLLCLYGESSESTWPDSAHLDTRVALVGHSRGGAAVTLAAQAIADGLVLPDLEIEAIVALAPAHGEEQPLGPDVTPAYFTLQGARDSDTLGASLAWYDRIGAQDPQMIRGLTWVFGAGHQRFHQGLLFAGSGELQASLDAEGHWTMARAYVGGFVIWRLRGRESYRGYFTGEALPESVLLSNWSESPGVFAGLADGTGGRRLIHGFDGDALSPADDGGSVSAIGFSKVQLGPLAELDAPWSVSQRDHGLRLEWTAGTEAALIVDLDPASRDASAYAMLSLRLGRTFDDPQGCGPASPSTPITLIVRDGNAMAELDLTTALFEPGSSGRIPAPDRLVPETFGNWVTPECHAQDFLRPLRLPLTQLCEQGIDAADLRSIELRFGGQNAGGVLLDDLAFEIGETELPGCG